MERRDTNRNDGNGLAEETHLLLDVALELVAGCAGVRDVHDKLACSHMPLRGATCARLVAHRGDRAPLLAVTPPAPTATSTKRPVHHVGVDRFAAQVRGGGRRKKSWDLKKKGSEKREKEKRSEAVVHSSDGRFLCFLSLCFLWWSLCLCLWW